MAYHSNYLNILIANQTVCSKLEIYTNALVMLPFRVKNVGEINVWNRFCILDNFEIECLLRREHRHRV